VVSVHPSLQVVVPAGAYWKRALATPEPESVAVPESVTSPRRGEPGFVRVTEVGDVLSAVAPALSALSTLSTWLPPAPSTTDLTT